MAKGVSKHSLLEKTSLVSVSLSRGHNIYSFTKSVWLSHLVFLALYANSVKTTVINQYKY
jgi:hypothetical protein